MLAFFGKVCYHTQAVERRKQNPGVAKFGIALEWGSRGRWFESSHSDQIMGSSFGNFPLFLFCADSNPSKCDIPVAYCCHQFKNWWLPLFSPLRGENEIRIQSLGPYKHDGFDTNHRAFSILVDIYTAI